MTIRILHGKSNNSIYIVLKVTFIKNKIRMPSIRQRVNQLNICLLRIQKCKYLKKWKIKIYKELH